MGPRGSLVADTQRQLPWKSALSRNTFSRTRHGPGWPSSGKGRATGLTHRWCTIRAKAGEAISENLSGLLAPGTTCSFSPTGVRILRMTQPSVEEDPGVQTRLLPVEDRQIVVRQLNDTQLLLLGRETQLLVKESTPSERKLKATGILMDLLEAAIVQEEDVEYIRDMI